jgi:hypothetical protein
MISFETQIRGIYAIAGFFCYLDVGESVSGGRDVGGICSGFSILKSRGRTCS